MLHMLILAYSCWSISDSRNLLVVGGAAFSLAGVVHGGRADGAADELSGAGRHEVIHR